MVLFGRSSGCAGGVLVAMRFYWSLGGLLLVSCAVSTVVSWWSHGAHGILHVCAPCPGQPPTSAELLTKLPLATAQTTAWSKKHLLSRPDPAHVLHARWPKDSSPHHERCEVCAIVVEHVAQQAGEVLHRNCFPGHTNQKKARPTYVNRAHAPGQHKQIIRPA